MVVAAAVSGRRVSTDSAEIQPGRWQAWFDGSALPNPGRIGIGVVLLCPDLIRQEISQPVVESGCNNEAELLAMITALDLAAKAGARRLQLRGDSDFAIRAGRMLQQGDAPATQLPRLVLLLSRLNAMLDRFDSVELVWIPRHRNGAADRLARQAIGLPEKIAEVPVDGKRRRGRR